MACYFFGFKFESLKGILQIFAIKSVKMSINHHPQLKQRFEKTIIYTAAI